MFAASVRTYAWALADWSWLIGDRTFEPVAASPFGDLFLLAGNGVWFLDMLEGSLTLRWPDLASLQAQLATAEGQDEHLMAALAIGADRAGVTATASEVLTFKISPVIGGPIAVDNIETMGFVVASSISGKLHRQVKDLPLGTVISVITIDGDVP